MHIASPLIKTTPSLPLIQGVGTRVVEGPVLEHLGKTCGEEAIPNCKDSLWDPRYLLSSAFDLSYNLRTKGKSYQTSSCKINDGIGKELVPVDNKE